VRVGVDGRSLRDRGFTRGVRGRGSRATADVWRIQHRDHLTSRDAVAGGVRDCLAAFLQFLADEPRYADMLIVEVLAAGPAAIEHRNMVMRDFAELVRRGAKTVPMAQRPPDITAETIVGGIYEVVYSRVLSGQTSELPLLLRDLAYSLMQPYLGDEVARREASRPPSAAIMRFTW